MVGVAGFIIFYGDDDHQHSRIENANIQTFRLNEKNNVRIEIKAVLFALQSLQNDCKNIELNIFTDCISIINLLKRREILESNKFISKRSKTILNNADLYKEFFHLYDIVKPQIHWMKGHSQSKGQTYLQKNFSFVDKLVRKMMRSSDIKAS